MELEVVKRVVGEMKFKIKNRQYISQKDTESYMVIIEALEKQVPYLLTDISSINILGKIGTCKCGYQEVMEHQIHCIECGQKVKWD